MTLARRAFTGLALLCAVTWLVPRAVRADNRAGQSDADASSKPGSYSGVTIGAGEPPEPTPPPPGLQYATWPGFRADGPTGPEVFVQLTGPVKYKMRAHGRHMYIDLRDTRVHLRNSLRWVITRNFPGPVARFRLRELKGNEVRLEVRLSRRAKPMISVRTGSKYTYLVVGFAGQSRKR